jgi:hypothetical protein
VRQKFFVAQLFTPGTSFAVIAAKSFSSAITDSPSLRRDIATIKPKEMKGRAVYEPDREHSRRECHTGASVCRL